MVEFCRTSNEQWKNDGLAIVDVKPLCCRCSLQRTADASQPKLELHQKCLVPTPSLTVTICFLVVYKLAEV